MHRNGFRVGGVSVEISSARSQDVALIPSLRPFCARTDYSDIDLRIVWTPELQPTSGLGLFDSGSSWRLHGDEFGFLFDFNAPFLGEQPYKKLQVDSSFRRAVLQMNESYFAGSPFTAEPLEYPLDELLIMHRLTQEQAIELHGVGIVGPDGLSNLFVGHSGAGKSTTARLWTSQHEVEILSDDRIIVRADPKHGTVPGDAGRIFMFGTPWHGEAHFALPQHAAVQRIFVLEHGTGNVITRLNRSQMVAELFARSFVPFHSHEYVDNALAFLERLADSIPCYRYCFEPDERAVEKILNFHD